MVVKIVKFIISENDGTTYTYLGMFKNLNELSQFIKENKEAKNDIDITFLKTVFMTVENYNRISNQTKDDELLTYLF